MEWQCIRVAGTATAMELMSISGLTVIRRAVVGGDLENGFDGVDGPFLGITGVGGWRIIVHSTFNEPQCSYSGTSVREDPWCCRTPPWFRLR